MRITFQETIKTLRRARDLTQEQLAEVFGVSPQAVSRWETGVTLPDVTLLPNLAAYFGVTVDDLLGAGQEARTAQIQAHLHSFDEAMNRGLVNDAVELARAAAREFPGSWPLQNQLMYALFVAGSDDGNIPNWRENQQNYGAEIVALGEKILRFCPEDALRLEAQARLAFHYCETGRKSQGRALIETLPAEASCREQMLYWALEGEERLSFLRGRITKGLELLTWAMRAFLSRGGADTPAARIAWREKVARCVALALDGSFGGWHEQLAKLAAENAKDALALGDRAAALDHLAQAAEHAAANIDDEPCHTADTRPLPLLLREEYLILPCFDPLRADGRFQDILRQLEQL
ncbi:MAG: helix-turn-helix domain-containing protein [Oscillospiraceae bacterium]|nr:helix-turn-helix domain-containing protein [Oscillospiraceae bacterium]